MRTAVIVVTYNRLALLKENINALLEQKCEDYSILVINNASTDGTEQYIQSLKNEKIEYFNTGENIGGAGGFSYGMRKAIEQGFDYAWLMDDDSIPQPEALNSLLNKANLLEDRFSFMASLVYWTDNKLFKMNLPEVNYKTKNDVKFDIISKYKVMPIETCSFVGCFVNLRYAIKVGLPIKEFFIYGDDVEYTTRLKKEAPAYLDFDSIIIHKAPSNKGADIATADKDRIQRFYYQSRNGMYTARKNHTILKRIITIIKRFGKILFLAKDCKFSRIRVLIKGSIAGLFFNPKIEFIDKDKNREQY